MSSTLNIVHNPTPLEICHNSHPDPPASPFHTCCDAHTLQVFVPHNNRETRKERQHVSSMMTDGVVMGCCLDTEMVLFTTVRPREAAPGAHAAHAVHAAHKVHALQAPH